MPGCGKQSFEDEGGMKLCVCVCVCVVSCVCFSYMPHGFYNKACHLLQFKPTYAHTFI